MSCDYTENVSLLIDGELAPAAAKRMRKHISECRVCHQLEQDFLSLRTEIQSYDFETDTVSQKQALGKILAPRRVPWWHRRIAVPAPVFALVIVSLLALGAWSLFIRGRSANPVARVTNETAQPSQPDQGTVDLSRYDRGERAVLYKVRRSQ